MHTHTHAHARTHARMHACRRRARVDTVVGGVVVGGGGSMHTFKCLVVFIYTNVTQENRLFTAEIGGRHFVSP